MLQQDPQHARQLKQLQQQLTPQHAHRIIHQRTEKTTRPATIIAIIMGHLDSISIRAAAPGHPKPGKRQLFNLLAIIGLHAIVPAGKAILHTRNIPPCHTADQDIPNTPPHTRPHSTLNIRHREFRCGNDRRMFSPPKPRSTCISYVSGRGFTNRADWRPASGLNSRKSSVRGGYATILLNCLPWPFRFLVSDPWLRQAAAAKGSFSDSKDGRTAPEMRSCVVQICFCL